MKESALRDLIAQKISQLKPGLTLLQKEQYIPGEHGTKSFIDLYARDEKGRHVLIELKRSNTAARQALHEVSKYVEQVKQHFGAKDSEIFAIIASTEWGELLLPFSRFCEDAGFSIEKIQIDVTEDYSDCQARPISPLATIRGRLIAPWHHIYWYTDKDALQRGIAAIEGAYSAKGIDDYVIVSFYLPDPSPPEERRAALLSEVANMLKVPQASLFASLASFSPPTYEYMAYAAVQMLPDETCLQIISCDEALFEEAQNAILLMPKGPALTFSQLIKKYYHGSLAALLETVTWGGRDERDSYLVEDLGAQYQSYRFDILHGTATGFFTLQDAKWRPCGPVALPVLFQIYAEKNQSLVREILETIKPHDRGTFFECHPANP